MLSFFVCLNNSCRHQQLKLENSHCYHFPWYPVLCLDNGWYQQCLSYIKYMLSFSSHRRILQREAPCIIVEHILCVCVYMHMCIWEHVIQDIERPTLTEAWRDSEFQTQCLISLPGSKHDTCFSEFHTPTCQYCPCWGCVWKGRWRQEGSHHCLLLFSHSLTTENKRDLSETRNQIQWDLKLPRHKL